LSQPDAPSACGELVKLSFRTEELMEAAKAKIITESGRTGFSATDQACRDLPFAAGTGGE
jgi:hypothetical protein